MYHWPKIDTIFFLRVSACKVELIRNVVQIIIVLKAVGFQSGGACLISGCAVQSRIRKPQIPLVIDCHRLRLLV